MADEHGTARDDVAVISEALDWFANVARDFPGVDRPYSMAHEALAALAAREQTLRLAVDEISGRTNVGSDVWEIANAALEETQT